MRETMDLNRFEALVAAYGATPARWPDDERVAAEALAKSDPRAAALLAEADTIDALLFAHRVPAPSRTLHAMVIESAPRRRPALQRARYWWTGLALALAAGCGALAGSAATAALETANGSQVRIYDHDDLPTYDETSEENAL